MRISRLCMQPPWLALKRGPRRMIRAVDLGMAAHAAASQRLWRRHSGRQLTGRQRDIRVTCFRVALLAQERLPLHEKSRIAAPVRLVAGRTVLRDWRVLPQEGTALLRMAGKASIVERTTDEREVGHRTMRIVAVAARHALLPHRVCKGEETLRLLPRVTCLAGFRLRRLDQHGIVRFMHLVATHAGDAFALVRAAGPVIVNLRTVGVTAETRAILLFDRCG